jgi:CheY-like chemotaxis protein
VFNPFSPADAGERRARGGGLTLAISKQLVEAMGGRIGVRSQEGQGAQFFVSLPVDTSIGPPDESLPGAVGKRALVASDHQTTRLVMRRHLEAFGFDVDDVGDTPNLSRLIREAYAFVVLDVAMPGLPLQSGAFRSAPPLIVLVPLSGDADDVTRLMRPCDQLLTKPVKRASVLATVLAALATDARSIASRSLSA